MWKTHHFTYLKLKQQLPGQYDNFFFTVCTLEEVDCETRLQELFVLCCSLDTFYVHAWPHVMMLVYGL